METASTTPPSRELNPWVVYGICLLISVIFFFLFGFNSPIYFFNTDPDFNWFMTMGNGLAHGKIPYRDLFDHKGPIVYFVFAFAHFFWNPRIIIFIIEIICMSLFFFFAYRISRKRLNSFYSLACIPFLAIVVFTSWCRLGRGSNVEGFCLPILTYFLLCWLEFLIEKRSWNWLTSLCLGLCFGIIFWIKYTLFYFMLLPMLFWLIISIRRHEFRTLVTNILLMFLGVLTVTLPILIFYASQNALSDLFYVYFYINTVYSSFTISPTMLFIYFKKLFEFSLFVIILVTLGVGSFTRRHWQSREGILLLASFFSTFILTLCSCSGSIYYFNILVPYTVFGIIEIVNFTKSKLLIKINLKMFYVFYVFACIAICTPFSILFRALQINKCAPLTFANIISDYEIENNIKASLFCYKIIDYGFYNATGIIPNDYYFAQSNFDEKKDQLPEMYSSFKNSIIEHKYDFVITELNTWYKENELLSKYYSPYPDKESCSQIHIEIQYGQDGYKTFILLKAISI